jgi:hypothetical protein
MVRARFFLPAVALVATTLEGQELPAVTSSDPAVSGVVRDVAGTPVSQVEVGVIRGDRLQQFVVTAPDGKFLLTGVGSGLVPLRVRRIGYAMQFFDVDTRIPSSRNLDIVLTTNANELEEVVISGQDVSKLRAFYERKAQRSSYAKFLDQDQIRKMGPLHPSDLFRTVPGISIRSASGGNSIRIRGCQPMVWLDGQKVPGAELDEVIQPSEIAAIEFYPSSAGIPAQYLERTNRLCGSVLVWTRTQ